MSVRMSARMPIQVTTIVSAPAVVPVPAVVPASPIGNMVPATIGNVVPERASFLFPPTSQSIRTVNAGSLHQILVIMAYQLKKKHVMMTKSER